MAKTVCLISGGIDSPVAAHIMLEKGWELVFVYMDTSTPVDRRNRERATGAVDILRKKFGGAGKLYIVQHGKNLGEFSEKLERRFTCVFCKRLMYRVAERVAEMEGAKYILTGENLGQVASQTLQNLSVLDRAASLPVARPLLGYDKQEIIKFARETGTYLGSVSPAACCAFIPEKPSTAARLEKIEDEEKKVDIAGLVEQCLSKAEVLSS